MKTDLVRDYSASAEKLLAQPELLGQASAGGGLRPVTVQVAPTEACDSECPFCSVSGRPKASRLPFSWYGQLCRDFRLLGAKSVELTGGGNPLLYRDLKADVNDLVRVASRRGLKVGIITNAHTLGRLRRDVHGLVSWVRVSLIKLDEGVSPADYDLAGFPEEKVGWSYITYDGMPAGSLDRVREVAGRFPRSKFVRVAGDCTRKGANAEAARRVPLAVLPGRGFVKDTGDDPHDGFCGVGLVRPYVAPHPAGDGRYLVYTCTSHVLEKRTYDPAYALCEVKDIPAAWEAMNGRLRQHGFPYEVRGNGGRGWSATCKHCFYAGHNRLLDALVHPPPDADFA